ncbi:hypothetical protein ACFE04_025701 [Oxalis oulophora]
MDESEKRRERLKAMRDEAAQSNDIGFPPNPVISGSLSNPLIELPQTTPSFQQGESRATQRFGYYTDPMAAFTASKKRTHDVDHSQPPHYNPPPGATSHDHAYHEMHQSQGPYSNAAYHGNPRGPPTRPFPIHQGNPEAWNPSGHAANNYSALPYSNQMVNPFPTYERPPGDPNRSGGGGYGVGPNIPGNSFQPMGSPRFNYGQSRPRWPANSTDFHHQGPPRPDFGHQGGPRPEYGYRGRPRPDFRHQGSPGPGHGSGRGRGSWNRGGGRGSNFDSSSSDWNVGPGQFYDKSMVEDPWQNMEPVLWKDLHDTSDSLRNPSSSNSSLPKSISMKKPKVSESYNNSSGQPSLAEYLASALDETVDDTPSG